jgi:hypothetical protein
MPTVPAMSRSVSGVPAFIDPRAGWAKLAPQITVPWIKNALSWDFHSPKMIKNAHKKCTQVDQKRPNFCFRYFPQISTLMEIPQGNTMENSGKQNPKMGFKSPPSTMQLLSCLHSTTYDTQHFT